VRLVDTNVLLYAADTGAEHHRSARTWLEDAVSSLATVLVPWPCVIGFLRNSTNPRFYPRPTSAESSLSFLHAVLTAPVVINGEPDHRHLDRVATLLAATGTGGNLVNDAHLAALALQYDATVVSYDNDFSRFPGVRWERPTAADG
jgi:toxin-antitoxin system PIN domain toxin